MGAMMTGECMAYLWVPLKRVSCTFVMDANVSKPIQCLLSFYLIAFFFQETS
jgi:hypothetical protein